MKRKRTQGETEQLEPIKDIAGFYLWMCRPGS